MGSDRGTARQRLRLYTCRKPCPNSKKIHSPKYETQLELRHESWRPMRPAPFHYHAPKTIEEAVATLAEVAPDDGRVLAGGQSLVPIMAFRLARPAHLVDINGVTELARLAVESDKNLGDKLAIGAC